MADVRRRGGEKGRREKKGGYVSADGGSMRKKSESRVE